MNQNVSALCLPINMEKYRWLLENQYELGKIYNENKYKYKLQKNKEEKKRWKASKMQQSDKVLKAKQ